MRALINDQTITFDNHTAGDGSVAVIDGLHMHKRMNGKRHKGIDVIFPLDSTLNYKFRGASANDKITTRIINEIQKTVEKDPSKLNELVKTVVEVISGYSQNDDFGDRTDHLIRGAERIARFFSKKKKVVNKMLEKFEDEIEIFITQHEKTDGEYFYIKQDIKRELIKIGDDLEAINYANERRA